MEPIKEFSRTQLSLDNCIIPEERLLHTPSTKDGVSHDLEVDLRIVGCEYIQSSGLLLRLPQVAMATAQVLYQRFYYAKSFVKYGIQPMAMACIFVAAKIEENCRRLRDVINVFHHLKQKRMGSRNVVILRKNSLFHLVRSFEKQRRLCFMLEESTWTVMPIVPMEYMGEEYFRLKSTVIKYERYLLKELGFCVHVKHPHKLIITYLQILEMEKNTALAQKAWNFMNDSLRTNVFVRFSPETIACACIFLAARHLQIPLPQKPAWWTVFDTSYRDIEAISMEVLALYSRPKRYLEDLERDIGVLKAHLVKKQVEIKEVNLKKSPSGGDTAVTGSPLQGSPAPQSGSPIVNTTTTTTAAVGNPASLSQESKLSQSLQASSSSISLPTSPIQNGSQKPYKSLSPSPCRSKHRSVSPPPPSKQKERSRSRSPHKTRTSPRPIISPIKLSSSSSESLSERSNSPSNRIQENGSLDHYKVDTLYEQEHRSRRERHKHRSHRHERSRHRDSSREHHSSRHYHDRHRDRAVYYREHEYERERGVYSSSSGGSRRERDREREREKGKPKKSESLRYR